MLSITPMFSIDPLQVHMELSPAQHSKVLETLDENLRHPHAAIQRAAEGAVQQYTLWVGWWQRSKEERDLRCWGAITVV